MLYPLKSNISSRTHVSWSGAIYRVYTQTWDAAWSGVASRVSGDESVLCRLATHVTSNKPPHIHCTTTHKGSTEKLSARPLTGADQAASRRPYAPAVVRRTPGHTDAPQTGTAGRPVAHASRAASARTQPTARAKRVRQPPAPTRPKLCVRVRAQAEQSTRSQHRVRGARVCRVWKAWA